MAATVTLSLSDGTQILAWESLSIRDEYTDPLGSMSFTVAPPRHRIHDYAALLVKGDKVSVAINGVLQSTALIQTVKTAISASGATQFTIEAQSLLAPLYEGAVIPHDYTFRSDAPVPVGRVVLDIAKRYGFTKLLPDERANRDAITGRPIRGQGELIPVDRLKFADAQAHEGETAYAMLARVVTRLGVCLRLSAGGILMLSRPNYVQDPSYRVRQGYDGGGVATDYFTGDISITDTNEGQHSIVTVRGQAPDTWDSRRAVRPLAAATPAQLSDRFWSYRSSAAPNKPKFLLDKNARDKERCLSVAKLAIGLPARKAYVLTGTVPGFISSSGTVWSVDTVVDVHLEAIGLNESMWVLAREFTQSRNGGQETHLTIIPRGFLVLGDG
jgi:prophage tail gpP-like protein